MALFSNSAAVFLGGALAGAATAFAFPKALPALAGALRPAVKSALKASMLGSGKGLSLGMDSLQRGREALARLGESFEDLLAEVKQEVEHEASSSQVTPTADTAHPTRPS